MLCHEGCVEVVHNSVQRPGVHVSTVGSIGVQLVGRLIRGVLKGEGPFE